MKKENFKTLLEDLYEAYNPEHLKYVDALVEKNSRMEIDAVDMILIKYNTKDQAHYDPEKSTDEYKIQLIKDYENGKRTLKGFTLEMQIKRNKEHQLTLEKENQEQSGNKLDEVKSNVNEKLTEQERKIQEAVDKKITQLKGLLEQAAGKPVKLYDNVEIEIKSNYTESKLTLPNKESLAGLGKGTKIIALNDKGKPIGLIIEDIIYDTVSHPEGIPIIEIVINKH